MVKDLLVILIASSLVNNVVLSQFLGLCPFLGVSKKTETATGMGVAVIFVITLASAVAGAIYKYILVPLKITYCPSGACAVCGDVFKEIYPVAVPVVGCVSAAYYDQLCSVGRSTYQCAEELWYRNRNCERICDCGGINNEVEI